jgi:hypothetical protein
MLRLVMMIFRQVLLGWVDLGVLALVMCWGEILREQ